jgi:hypothetical protein
MSAHAATVGATTAKVAASHGLRATMWNCASRSVRLDDYRRRGCHGPAPMHRLRRRPPQLVPPTGSRLIAALEQCDRDTGFGQVSGQQQTGGSAPP